MKTKLVWTVILFGVVAFLINSHLERSARREAERAEQAAHESDIKNAVAASARRSNAITDWEQRLSRGERYRLSPVLTIELEELWQGDRPVLFVGSIKDVSSAGPDTYTVLLEQSLYNMDYMFSTELRLSLTAPKAGIDEFLKQHTDILSGAGFDNGVAVIGQIHRISAADELREDGDRIEIKTGEGHLLDLVYTGDVFF
jgi:hypothetical protein